MKKEHTSEGNPTRTETKKQQQMTPVKVKRVLMKGPQTSPTAPNTRAKTSQTHPQDPLLKEATSNSECKSEDGRTEPM
jgi:hypothetical protein